MTSNITHITDTAHRLVGKHVTVNTRPRSGWGNFPHIVESGVCTGLGIVYTSEGFFVDFTVDELKKKVRYPRGGLVETIIEGMNTDYLFPLDKLTAVHAEPWSLVVRLFFDAPASEFLVGSTVLTFTEQ